MPSARAGAVVVLTLLAVMEASAQERTSVVLPVLVYNYANVPVSTLHEAQSLTARIFQKSGVSFAWHDCRVKLSQPQTDAYCSQPGPANIALKILAKSLTHQGPDKDVAGFVPAGEMVSDAYVFYDRLRDMAVQESREVAVLLGTVIAHEFGHLLLGADAHSGRGLMQAQWSVDKLARASVARDHFSAEENERLYQRALSRVATSECPQNARKGED